MANAAHNSLREHQILDGYRLIRPLGSGGFGQVWLCRSQAVGGLHALKFIAAGNPNLLDKEFGALVLYRRSVARVGSPHLVPIEHINRTGDGLYYIMPVADGATAVDPEDPSWMPLTLAEKIAGKMNDSLWFTAEEVVEIFVPILEGIQVLSDAGLVHRDVKPDNILFLDGRACLGDISLLRTDLLSVTRAGTHGYTAPSWYKGGHPDMYGAAATLYTLITGNLPDCLGRSAFKWPKQDATMIAENDRRRWDDFHSIIRRAMEERFSERFPDFIAMARSLQSVVGAATTAGEMPHQSLPLTGTRPADEQSASPPATPPLPSPKQSSDSKDKAVVRGLGWGALALLLLGFSGWIAFGVMGPGRRLEASKDGMPADQAPDESASSAVTPVVSGGVAEASSVPAGGNLRVAEPEATGSGGTASPPTSVSRVPFTPPEVDRSPRDYRKGNSASADSRLAYNSLAWFMRKSGLLTQPERAKLGETLARIDVLTSGPDELDFHAAVNLVDSCMEEIPTIRQSTNAKLARLLFLYLNGDRDQAREAESDPALRILDNDELAYRVELMNRLRMDPEPLLDQIIASPETGPNRLVQALMERARLRGKFNNVEAGREDVVSALKLSAANPAMRAWVTQELADLRRHEEKFARKLQDLPGK